MNRFKYHTSGNVRRRPVLLVFVILALTAGPAAAADLLPEGVTIKEQYEPGAGNPVGRVELVQGNVVVVHSVKDEAFKISKGNPLFQNDTVITLDKGRLRFSLNDGSMLTLASESKMTLNRSIYDPDAENRSSFINMGIGKARCLIKKLVGFKRSEFRIKTKTAVVGVRGSDFIVRAGEEKTEVTALEDTNVEVISLAAPEAEPVQLLDFERTVVELGALPSAVEKVSMQDVEMMLRDFDIFAEGMTEGERLEIRKDEAGEKDQTQAETEAQAAPQGESAVTEETVVVISEEDLSSPEETIAPEEMAPETISETPVAGEDPAESGEIAEIEEIVEETQETISEEQHEEAVKEETAQAPDFPNTP